MEGHLVCLGKYLSYDNVYFFVNFLYMAVQMGVHCHNHNHNH